MTVPAGIVIEKPYILLEPYTSNVYSSNDYMQGHILQVWQVDNTKAGIGAYVFFKSSDAINVKYGGNTYILLDQNNIIFSFTVS